MYVFTSFSVFQERSFQFFVIFVKHFQENSFNKKTGLHCHEITKNLSLLTRVSHSDPSLKEAEVEVAPAHVLRCGGVGTLI